MVLWFDQRSLRAKIRNNLGDSILESRSRGIWLDGDGGTNYLMMKMARRLLNPRSSSSRRCSFASSTTTTADYDIVVAGGGVVGASVAYHAALMDPSLRIAVVERDPRRRRGEHQTRCAAFTSTVTNIAELTNFWTTRSRLEIA